MFFPVTMSDIPLEFDTLPALKTRFFYHDGTLQGRDTASVYTLGRLYVADDALQLSLSAFEREPADGSSLAFAVAAGPETSAVVVLTPKTAFLRFPNGQPTLPGGMQAVDTLLDCDRFAGQDEQGWYWGARLRLAAPLLQKAGCALTLGASFGAALFKHRQGTPALGASCPIKNPATPLDAAGFELFTLVSY